MVKKSKLEEEYLFISNKKDENPYLLYHLILAYKGQKPFSTKSEEVEEILNNLSGKREDYKKDFLKLLEIDGVAFPVASAILHFKFPNDHAIIDKNALKGIEEEKHLIIGEGKIEYINKKDSKNNEVNLDKNIKTYTKYIQFLKSQLDQKLKTLRDVELHYFEIGKGLNNKKRLKNSLNNHDN